MVSLKLIELFSCSEAHEVYGFSSHDLHMTQNSALYVHVVEHVWLMISATVKRS